MKLTKKLLKEMVKQELTTEISSRVKNKIKDIMRYDHIDDLADYIEQFDIDKSKWRVISHYFDDIRDETMGIKPSGYADKSRKELEKILFKVIKEGKLNEYGPQNDGPRLKVGQKIKWNKKYDGIVKKVFVKVGQIYYHISYAPKAGGAMTNGADFVTPQDGALTGNKDHPQSSVKRSYIEGKLTEKVMKIKYYKTVSKKEWNKTHKNYKSVIDGVKYLMVLDPKRGTILAPVTVK